MSLLTSRVTGTFRGARESMIGKKEGLPGMLLVNYIGDHATAIPITEDIPRDMWVKILRKAYATSKVDMYCLISEAWYINRPSTENLDLNLRPSEQPDRRECVFVYGESRTEQYSLSGDIIRDESGVIIAIDDKRGPMGAIFDGRFTGFLYRPTPH